MTSLFDVDDDDTALMMWTDDSQAAHISRLTAIRQDTLLPPRDTFSPLFVFQTPSTQ